MTLTALALRRQALSLVSHKSSGVIYYRRRIGILHIPVSTCQFDDVLKD